MMKISFIIPAYNASKTIVDCLDSIYNNVMLNDDDFEIIVIDDCSTDNTISIIEGYCSNKTNIVLLKQEVNSKQGAARNRGIKKAKGKYITFVDSDDIIEPGIDAAITFATLNNAEILVCHYNRVDADGNKSEWKLINEPIDCVNGSEFMKTHYDWFFVGAPWGYLFSKEYLDKLKIDFAEGVFTEDVDWVIQHLYYAKYIYPCSHIIYCNIHSVDSATTGNKNSFRCACVVLEAFRELDFAQEIMREDKRLYKWLLEINIHKIQEQMKRLWKISDKNYYAFYKYIRKYLKSSYIKELNWSHKVSFLLKYPNLSICILYIIGAPLSFLRMIKNK